MKITQTTWMLAAAIAVLAAAPAGAATISTDTVVPPNISNSDNPGLEVISGATLTVDPPGQVLVGGGGALGLRLGLAGTSSGHLVLKGGLIRKNESGNGSATGVQLLESSTANISGGTLEVNETGQGGAVKGLQLLNSSSLVFTGGTLDVGEAGNNHNAVGVSLQDSSNFTMTGGTITLTGSQTGNGHRFLEAIDAATAEITGGEFTGNGYGLLTNDTASVTVIGAAQTDFLLNGAPVPFGELAATNGVLTGTLADGNSFQWDIFRNGNSTITLVAAPEPSSVVIWALAALALCGGFRCAGRRRKTG